jgi:hypothetical protein
MNKNVYFKDNRKVKKHSWKWQKFFFKYSMYLFRAALCLLIFVHHKDVLFHKGTFYLFSQDGDNAKNTKTWTNEPGIWIWKLQTFWTHLNIKAWNNFFPGPLD